MTYCVMEDRDWERHEYMDIHKFWRDVLEQNADAIRDYFDKDAYINWHCTNEHFNVDEFIIVNCDYPGDWNGKVVLYPVSYHSITG